jgi:uncharacterized protein YoxC
MRKLACIFLAIEGVLLFLYFVDKFEETKNMLLKSEKKVLLQTEQIQHLNGEKTDLLVKSDLIAEDLVRAADQISLLESTVHSKDKIISDLNDRQFALEESLKEQINSIELLGRELTNKELLPSNLRDEGRTLEERLHQVMEKEKALRGELSSKDKTISQLNERVLSYKEDLQRAREIEETLTAKLLANDQIISELQKKARDVDEGSSPVSSHVKRINQNQLGGLEGVEVVVEEFARVIEEDGLSPQQVKKEVESILERGDVRVLNPQNRMSVKGMPYLSICVEASKDTRDYIFYIELSLKEMAVLERDPSKMFTGAALWRKGFLGRKSELNDVLMSVADLVKAFIADFAAANPKMTTKLPPFKEKVAGSNATKESEY